MATTELIAQLRRHEGLRLFVYRCPTGHRTIGYGHNLDASPLSGEERKATGYRDGVTCYRKTRLLLGPTA